MPHYEQDAAVMSNFSHPSRTFDYEAQGQDDSWVAISEYDVEYHGILSL